MSRRLHFKNAAYMLTICTNYRYPFFKEDIFCNIFLDILSDFQEKKSYNVIGYKINPEHIHIILKPFGEYNISQIMQSVKRISSCNINQLIFFGRKENKYENLEWTPALIQYRKQFLRKYNYEPNNYPVFKWLKSFDDGLIKETSHLMNSRKYLKKQMSKHSLKENKFLFVKEDIPKNIFIISEHYKK